MLASAVVLDCCVLFHLPFTCVCSGVWALALLTWVVLRYGVLIYTWLVL